MPSDVFTVPQVNHLIAGLLKGDPRLAQIAVEGEVSSFSNKGNLWFTLRGENSSLSCVVWKSVASRIQLRDEMKIVAFGKIEVYEPHGTYRMAITRVQETGVGALMQEIRARAERLAAEGLFDPRRKRHLPLLPRRVAIVTSNTAAALQDVWRQIQRRYPNMPVLFVHAPVQGESAPPHIVAALTAAGHAPLVDVVLLVRGGGSYEELSAFQDEAVVRAIAASPVPVVVGVGHEIDTTLADHVADVRAATPTAAAELAVPERHALVRRVMDDRGRLTTALRDGVTRRRTALMNRAHRLEQASPSSLVSSRRGDIDVASRKLEAALLRQVETHRRGVEMRQRRLALSNPAARVAAARGRMDGCERRLHHSLGQLLERGRQRQRMAGARLTTLSPLATLSRGYTMSRDPATGKLLTSALALTAGAQVEIRWADGGWVAVADHRIPQGDAVPISQESQS